MDSDIAFCALVFDLCLIKNGDPSKHKIASFHHVLIDADPSVLTCALQIAPISQGSFNCLKTLGF